MKRESNSTESLKRGRTGRQEDAGGRAVVPPKPRFERKKLRNVQTWIDYRAADLMADWELACAGKKPMMILPLS